MRTEEKMNEVHELYQAIALSMRDDFRSFLAHEGIHLARDAQSEPGSPNAKTWLTERASGAVSDLQAAVLAGDFEAIFTRLGPRLIATAITHLATQALREELCTDSTGN